jgi:hypothetical protein
MAMKSRGWKDLMGAAGRNPCSDCMAHPNLTLAHRYNPAFDFTPLSKDIVT